MGFFDDVKEKAIRDSRAGGRYREKDPSEMTDRELDRKLQGNESISRKKKYAEEVLRRKGEI